jgi:hypothetical protein
MKGQWIGPYNGSVGGRLMINVDEVDDHFEGVAYVNPSASEIPSSVAYLTTNNKDQEQEAIAYINPVDPRTGFLCKWEDIRHLYGEGVVHSGQAN